MDNLKCIQCYAIHILRKTVVQNSGWYTHTLCTDVKNVQCRDVDVREVQFIKPKETNQLFYLHFSIPPKS